jgi:hypothetical protein
MQKDPQEEHSFQGIEVDEVSEGSNCFQERRRKKIY